MPVGQVEAKILSRDYNFQCSPDDVPLLQKAIACVIDNIERIRAAGKITDTERIAVMAAIRIAGERHNVVATKHGEMPGTPQPAEQVREIVEMLDSALRLAAQKR